MTAGILTQHQEQLACQIECEYFLSAIQLRLDKAVKKLNVNPDNAGAIKK